MDLFPRYVRHRSAGRRGCGRCRLGIALDHSFRRLTRSRPTVVVGDELARHYGGSETLVSGFSLVRDADLVAAEAPPSGVGRDGQGAHRHTTRGGEEPASAAGDPRAAAGRGRLAARDCRRRPAPRRARGEGAQARPYRCARAHRLRSLRGRAEERYRLADAFLHVSLTEGLPQVLFEAAAAGLPIVATDVGGVAEALGSERGIVVPPGDAGAAARACSPCATRASAPGSCPPRSSTHGRARSSSRPARFSASSTPPWSPRAAFTVPAAPLECRSSSLRSTRRPRSNAASARSSRSGRLRTS